MTETFRGVEYPDIRFGTCPATGDEQPVIVRPEKDADECYHCGVDVEKEE